MNTKKTVIISVISFVLVVAIIVGVLFGIKGGSKSEVNVFAVSDLSMTDDYIGMSEGYGSVRTDKMQPIYISDTQEIVKIYVAQGQKVKVGDPLIEYDTTLTNLELQKKDIEIQKLELSIKNAKKELQEIKSYIPYVPKPEPEPEPEPENPVITPVPTLISGTGTQEDPYKYLWDYSCSFDASFILGLLGENNEAYVQFYIYEQNSLELNKLISWGMVFTRSETGYDFTMYEVLDELVEPEPEPEPEPEEETSGFTAAEIAEMRAAKEAEIATLELDLEIQRVNYKAMEKEMASGVIESTIDGVVASVIDEETARLENQPIIKVSGGGGYYIDIAVGEFALETLEIGQSVEVYSYETGAYATGEIHSISMTPMPVNSGWTQGNTNISYYPYTVFVGEDADFMENEYVSVTYSTAGTGGGIYLENAFVLSESGKSYVYADNNGVLEKRVIKTGKSLWGSYIEIKDGLTVEDYVAFPYGKEVKEGAVTVQATLDELYGF